MTADSHIECYSSSAFAKRSCSQIQEEYGYWRNRATNCFETRYSNVELVASAVDYYCAGHGYDKWRNRSDGKDTKFNTKVTFSVGVMLSC